MFEIQKPSFFKRFSAGLFDLIITLVLITGFAFIISSVTGYADYSAEALEIMESYTNEYNVDLSISWEEDYLKLTEEEQQRFIEGKNALNNDEAYIRNQNMMLSLVLVIISLSPLLALLVWELLIPLLLKNGQTLGKRIFGIGVMRVDGIEVSPVIMFIRTILGKFTVETMIPVIIAIMVLFGGAGILGTISLVGILVLQCGMYLFTQYHTMIHDSLSKTVVVEMSSQLIFKSEQDLIDYKNKLQQEAAQNGQY